jgi:hypothetical protein
MRAQLNALGEQVAKAVLRFRDRGTPPERAAGQGGLTDDEKRQAAEIMRASGDRMIARMSTAA